MSKFAFVRESYGERIGGIQGKILALATYINESTDFEPILITNDKSSLFSKRFSEKGFKIYELPYKNRIKFLWLYTILRNGYYLRRLVQFEKIRVLSAHKLRESLMCRVVRMKKSINVKNIFRVHTHIDGRGHSKFKAFFLHWIDQITSQYVDHFITISNVIKNELIEQSNIRESKITVVHNGIDALGMADSLPTSNQPLKCKVAIIGELQPRKSQIDMIKATHILNQKGCRFEMHFIGGNTYGDYQSKMIKIVTELGLTDQIKFHGHIERERIPEIIRDVPIVALNSSFEGIPTSLIEAMSLRKIVIGTDVGGTSELIENGVNGFLYRYGEVNDLANILFEIVQGPSKRWNKLREAAFKTWQKDYHSSVMFKGYHEVLLEVLNEGDR